MEKSKIQNLDTVKILPMRRNEVIFSHFSRINFKLFTTKTRIFAFSVLAIRRILKRIKPKS